MHAFAVLVEMFPDICTATTSTQRQIIIRPPSVLNKPLHVLLHAEMTLNEFSRAGMYSYQT